MNFTDYTVEDFVCDESFQRFCLEDPVADYHFWNNWITSHPTRKETIEAAKQLVLILSAQQGGRLTHLQHLKDGVERHDFLQAAIGNTSSRTARWKYWAAAAILGMLLGTAWLINHTTTPLTPLSQEKSNIISSGAIPRKSMVLPDGTTVVLRSNSALTLAPEFNKTNRQVTLTGEAFFEVSMHSGFPFTVHTTAMDIKVLGTIFNISAYPNTTITEASLFKGKIAVQIADPSTPPVILMPNQKIAIGNIKPYSISTLAADPVSHKATEIAWVRNRLEIENEPLATIAVKLGKWYGIPIQFADSSVKQYRYSGTFESETIWKALDALQLSYPFSFKMVDSTIIISK
ncbi:DUF4974 domain-containing protein [Chitinophaga silvatica]|uniref:DUF4974 domain-containing protein n=1 Tax=Chitinophaga silvatica TaxID=2282649 RepID=A0A3E1Y7M3_9BACT|nr:FecR domain-containing protein [Chitinophaga silvatica]RFS21069.1 DUF4974 domain-containing protein [Chitinophaga silvatica]